MQFMTLMKADLNFN